MEDRQTILSKIPPILPSWADAKTLRLDPLTEGGSIRKYYRIAQGGNSAIVKDSSQLPKDFESFLAIGKILEGAGVPVPKVLAILPDQNIALLEDLGDTALYHLATKESSKEKLLPHYEEVLSHLLRMQSSPELASIKRVFDFQDLRWETNYFYEKFVLGYCKTEAANEKKLFEEFDRLATKLDKIPRVGMHRDFQSQNIMVNSKGITFLDFQGARRGLPHYDLVSLLRDPYVQLPDEMEESLKDFYLKRARSEPWLQEKSFQETFTLAGIQRHSQALGAFAYLSMELKKSHFESHIPACLEYLRQELFESKEFPYFRELVEKVSI